MPWVIDVRTGRTFSYGELLARLNQRPAAIRTLCKPHSAVDALMEISAAIAFGAKLTLFDTDASEQEIELLGGVKGLLNKSESISFDGPVDSTTLGALAAGGSSARRRRGPDHCARGAA